MSVEYDGMQGKWKDREKNNQPQIGGEKEWEVERILNKRQVREKDKYLVCWKGFTVESDTWKERENLKNAQEAIKEFEKKYQQDIEDMAKQEQEKRTFRREELPGRFTAKKLFGWSDKRYDQVSQLCYGLVVIYCMVYHYTKRATLARLLANESPAIYVVHLNRYFVIPP